MLALLQWSSSILISLQILGLQTVLRLRKVPDAVYQLNNEVADLKTVISAVQDLAETDAPFDVSAPPHLLRALAGGKEAIIDLQRLLEHNVLKVSSGRVSKKAWLRHQKDIDELRKRLQKSNHVIGTAVSIET